jgi:N-acetylglucosaminyl-diphospho-decaprenol L-rhamnosyltransferase
MAGVCAADVAGASGVRTIEVMPRLSIIIVTYNSRQDLEACLRSLTEGATVLDREIVLVDNASTDGTAAYVREHWPGVRLIDAGGNLGFARANNLGIRQTFGDLVLLLNPDTSVPPGAIDRLVAALERDRHAAVAGPRLIGADGQAELSFGRMISPAAEVRQKILVTGRRGVLRAVVERMTRRTRYVDWVSGACLLARRADLEAAGLFDERFFLYTEDVDLCASIRSRGRRVLFVGDVEIVHRRGRSRASASAASEVAYRQSQIAFYEKHHPAWVPVLRAYLRLFGKHSKSA